LIRADFERRNSVSPGRLLDSNNSRVELPNTYSGPDALTKLLSDSIDETLTDLLGTRAREAVYDHLERIHSIARDEIPDNTDELFKLFERNFGATSKKVIGRVIAKKVYSKLDWEFRPIANFEFTDYLERIKTKLTKEVLDRAKSSTRQFP
jgi:hypothetical protein